MFPCRRRPQKQVSNIPSHGSNGGFKVPHQVKSKWTFSFKLRPFERKSYTVMPSHQASSVYGNTGVAWRKYLCFDHDAVKRGPQSCCLCPPCWFVSVLLLITDLRDTGTLLLLLLTDELVWKRTHFERDISFQLFFSPNLHGLQGGEVRMFIRLLINSL